jgi:hypothetical protein
VVPGYEIVRELGRGGMGVVYQARQTKLSRPVALKMILAGSHAGADDLARFQTEAEAIARLRQPNIVQVYEVGEHEGKPYFSLEFCGGGSLENKLGGTPLPPKEAASLVETLARAMQAAHEQHVIHRDLKPANVLLAEDGTPKITDFGLAKKLDEAGQTASGAVMGTPSYMAPEQAGGKAVGPLADVYALGAVLYECLTGRPPFKGPTAMDTILQVAAEEPVPPTQLQPGTPRDLETVCLKCLQKEPSRRYASACALADDLRRFQDGEPIVARPVGRLERAWKWARRRPAAAALLAVSVLAGLALVGTVGTAAAVIYGKNQDLTTERDRAKDAQKMALDEAEKARVAEGKALDKEKEALDEAEKARVAEGKARDQAEKAENALLDGLLRPIGHNWNPRLDPPEKQALDDVAHLDDRLRLRFLERGLSQPEAAERIGRRSGAVIAAVAGQDAALRERVRASALAALRKDGADWRVRVAGALITRGVGDRTPQFALEGVVALLEGFARTADANSREGYAPLIVDLMSRLNTAGARDAAHTALDLIGTTTVDRIRLVYVVATLASRMDAASAGDVASALVRAIAKEPEAGVRSQLSVTLADYVPRVDAVGARNAARTALELIPQSPSAATRADLAGAVAALTPRMDAAEAGKVCAEALTPLVQAITKESDASTRSRFAKAVPVLAQHLDAASARDAGTILAQAIPKEPNAVTRSDLAQAVAALAPRMEAGEATRLCAEAAATLAQSIPKEPNAVTRSDLAQAVAALAPRMDTARARDAATTLVQVIRTETNAYTRRRLAEAVAALVARLDAPEAAKVCADAAAALLPALAREPDPRARLTLAQAVAALAPRLDAAKAAKLCADAATPLAQALAREPDPRARLTLAQAVAALAPHLDAAGARDTATPLVQAIAKEPDAFARSELARAVAALAPSLGTAEAAKLCAEAATPVARAVPTETNNFSARIQSAMAVAALAPHLDAAGARDIATPLVQAIPKEPYENVRFQIAQAVAALAPRMDAASARETATALVQAIGMDTDANARNGLAQAVAALTARMDAAEAAKLCVNAASPLVQALSKETNATARTWLVMAVAALAEGMDPRDLADLLAKHQLPSSAAAALLDELAPLACRRFETVADAARWFRDRASELSKP